MPPINFLKQTMSLNTNLAPFAPCNADYLANLADEPDLAPGITAWPSHGYLLINDRLVPTAFLNRLETELSDAMFNYGEILSTRDVCGERFWNSLNADQRSVVGHCLLILIEQGRLGLFFHG